MESGRLELLCQIAKGIAAQFGSHCEVVVHDLTRHADHTIVAIENGHVSGRKVGDGASAVVLERMEHQEREARDHLCYLTRTPEGKILKSSTIYIKNARGRVTAILAINFDISAMLLAGEARSRRSRRRSSTSTTCWTSSSDSPLRWWESRQH